MVKTNLKNVLYVGTSGYSYKHWMGGRFYPSKLKTGQHLIFYANHFNSLELNVTYYRLPLLSTLERWRKVTPKDFAFAAKFNHLVTHYQRLKGCDESLKVNQVIRDGLGTKLAIMLAQLPPSFAEDINRLKDFLDLIKKGPGRWVPRLAVEFRHTSWLNERVYQLLTDYGCAICLGDWDECEVREPNEVDFVYVRRHSGRDGGCYTNQQIRSDAALIEKQLSKGRTVFAYYNNDLNCYAIRNAHELLAEIGRPVAKNE